MTANQVLRPDLETVTRLYRDSDVLRGLGFPDGTAGETPLIMLHAAQAFQALAIIDDQLAAYRTRVGADFTSAAVGLIENATSGEDPRGIARKFLDAAITECPDLAEAHFNLARLYRDRDDLVAAAECYRQVLALAPHQRAAAGTDLHAEAYWNLGEVTEALDEPADAIRFFDAAVASGQVFGVHHVRYAQLLRNVGRLEDAIEHFQLSMSYTHRYFVEFAPPAFEAVLTGQPVASAYRPIVSLPSGEAVIFARGAFYAVPETALPLDDVALGAFEVEDVSMFRHRGDTCRVVRGGGSGIGRLIRRLRRPENRVRRAESILALATL